MSVLARGIQSYLLLFGGVVSIVVVLATNRFLLDNTIVETGWPVLLGIAVALLVVVVGIRRFTAAGGDESRSIAPSYHWNNRK